MRRAAADRARLPAAVGPVRAPDRGQPQSTSRQTRYETFDAAARLLPAVGRPGRRAGAARVRAATPERIALSDRVCAGLAGHRAPAGRRRGPRARPHLPARRRTWSGSAATMSTWLASAGSAETRAGRVRGRPRAGAAGRRRAAGPHAGAAAAAGGRRVRRAAGRAGARRRCEARAAAGARGFAYWLLAIGAAAGDRPGAGDRARLPALRADHAARGRELLLRHPPAAARQAPDAMSAVYAFARRIDDIGDDGARRTTRSCRRCASERAMVARLGSSDDSSVDDPVRVALAHARRVYALPLDALELLIEGVELDVIGDQRYETFDELVGYCRRVAGSIGRLCVAIFTDGRATERDSRAGRRPRRGDAADQHPARRPRGRDRARPDLPAGRGPAAVRLRGPGRVAAATGDGSGR